jgi:hypothetical protein
MYRRNQRGAWYAFALENLLRQSIFVDSPVDSLAYPGVEEDRVTSTCLRGVELFYYLGRGLVEVEAELREPGVGGRVGHYAFLVLQRFEKVDGHALDVVHVAVLERLHHGVVVVVELEDDLIQLRSPPEIIGVGLEARVLAFFPLHGLEGARPDGRLVYEGLGLIRRYLLPDVERAPASPALRPPLHHR